MKLKAFFAVALTSLSMQTFAVTTTELIPETKADKLSYSLGALMAEQLKQFPEINADALAQGIKDVLSDTPLKLDDSEMLTLIDEAREAQAKKINEQMQAQASKNLAIGEEFLANNLKKPGVKSLAGGLQYKELQAGTGKKPSETDEVVVHYEGRLLDGSVFDSSYERGEPATFRLNQVIRGWTEGLQNMNQGSKWELFIPAEMAYGSRGIPGRIEPNSVLVFTVELLEVKNENSKS